MSSSPAFSSSSCTALESLFSSLASILMGCIAFDPVFLPSRDNLEMRTFTKLSSEVFWLESSLPTEIEKNRLSIFSKSYQFHTSDCANRQIDRQKYPNALTKGMEIGEFLFQILTIDRNSRNKVIV